jgi:preprotein translocase subunit SecA
MLRIFAPEWTVKALSFIGWKEGEPIYHRRISKGIERAQKKITMRNSQIRQRILEFDQILDTHRSNIYSLRRNVLECADLLDEVNTIFDNVICRTLQNTSHSNKLKKNYVSEFVNVIEDIVSVDISNPFDQYQKVSKLELTKWAKNVFTSHYSKREAENKKEPFERTVKYILLRYFNNLWQTYLKNLESLKSKMSMSTYTHYDILAWYRSESDRIFDVLISTMEDWFSETIFRLKFKPQEEIKQVSNSK